MLNFIKNLFDDNVKEIKRLEGVVENINSLEHEVSKLTDEQLRGKTMDFKQLLENGKTLDDILPEAFAVCREASKRILNMRHYDVQLIGGIVLHQGRIAEMRTGEGKTLVATLPVYLNALTGRGVHVVTVNDYLATRDCDWMGPLYRFLGLSVGLIVHDLDTDQRRQAYNADITYGTNSEFGFDYLRDNMVHHPERLVQRDLNYAIVDEVDSILIDEARTPLIISGQIEKPTDMYFNMAKVIPKLTSETDFTVDEKFHTVSLTEEGVTRVEELLGLDNLYDESNMEINHHLNQALKAHALMHRDKEYVVRDGQVVIVDEFTGRLMFGRRYNDGLHQAIEAKEGVKIESESQTLGTISLQNYFRMYNKLAGMTGTALTEEEEFKKIYKLEVIVIPTNKPMLRNDMSDVIYKNEWAKLRAVVDDVEQRYLKGQPVLVGTVTIAKSELLSALLKRKSVPHQVLNARHHDIEAEIIAQAGRFKAVTIATNMAGRGTDILLGGNPEILAKKEIKKKELNNDISQEDYKELVVKYNELCEEERNKVVELGGLHIIGTERHDSRRIDNQLRGRAGRQGDPGSSQFYISLEDDLMRLFGSDIAGLMERLGMEEDVPVENTIITRSIEAAQKRLENHNFNIRKLVLSYDDVMNEQRQLIYDQRHKVVTGENIADNIKETITAVVERSVDMFCPEGVYPEEWDLTSLLEYAENLYLPGHNIQVDEFENTGRQGLKEELLEKTLEFYHKREQELGLETMRKIERVILLRLVDEKWLDHLDAMDQLREGISLRSYGSKNPLIEYKFEAYEMFDNIIANIQDEVVRYVLRVNLVQEQPKEKSIVVENHDEDSVR